MRKLAFKKYFAVLVLLSAMLFPFEVEAAVCKTNQCSGCAADMKKAMNDVTENGHVWGGIRELQGTGAQAMLGIPTETQFAALGAANTDALSIQPKPPTLQLEKEVNPSRCEEGDVFAEEPTKQFDFRKLFQPAAYVQDDQASKKNDQTSYKALAATSDIVDETPAKPGTQLAQNNSNLWAASSANNSRGNTDVSVYVPPTASKPLFVVELARCGSPDIQGCSSYQQGDCSLVETTVYDQAHNVSLLQAGCCAYGTGSGVRMCQKKQEGTSADSTQKMLSQLMSWAMPVGSQSPMNLPRMDTASQQTAKIGSAVQAVGATAAMNAQAAANQAAASGGMGNGAYSGFTSISRASLAAQADIKSAGSSRAGPAAVAADGAFEAAGRIPRARQYDRRRHPAGIVKSVQLEFERQKLVEDKNIRHYANYIMASNQSQAAGNAGFALVAAAVQLGEVPTGSDEFDMLYKSSMAPENFNLKEEEARKGGFVKTAQALAAGGNPYRNDFMDKGANTVIASENCADGASKLNNASNAKAMVAAVDNASKRKGPMCGRNFTVALQWFADTGGGAWAAPDRRAANEQNNQIVPAQVVEGDPHSSAAVKGVLRTVLAIATSDAIAQATDWANGVSEFNETSAADAGQLIKDANAQAGGDSLGEMAEASRRAGVPVGKICGAYGCDKGNNGLAYVSPELKLAPNKISHSLNSLCDVQNATHTSDDWVTNKIRGNEASRGLIADRSAKSKCADLTRIAGGGGGGYSTGGGGGVRADITPPEDWWRPEYTAIINGDEMKQVIYRYALLERWRIQNKKNLFLVFNDWKTKYASYIPEEKELLALIFKQGEKEERLAKLEQEKQAKQKQVAKAELLKMLTAGGASAVIQTAITVGGSTVPMTVNVALTPDKLDQVAEQIASGKAFTGVPLLGQTIPVQISSAQPASNLAAPAAATAAAEPAPSDIIPAAAVSAEKPKSDRQSSLDGLGGSLKGLRDFGGFVVAAMQQTMTPAAAR